MNIKPPFLPTAISVAGGVALVASYLASQAVSSGIKSTSLVDVEDIALSTASLDVIENALPYDQRQAEDSQSDFQALLAASPFHSTREPFSRASAAQTVERAGPELQPQIVGFLGKDNNRRVMIDWNNGSPTGSFSVGDDTPFGRLTEIRNTSLSFENINGDRELRLFD
ncbi:MAG: hypothetical protein AAF292_14165 [Pseudomonadota bacterium]